MIFCFLVLQTFVTIQVEGVLSVLLREGGGEGEVVFGIWSGMRMWRIGEECGRQVGVEGGVGG